MVACLFGVFVSFVCLFVICVVFFVRACLFVCLLD